MGAFQSAFGSILSLSIEIVFVVCVLFGGLLGTQRARDLVQEANDEGSLVAEEETDVVVELVSIRDQDTIR